MIDTALALKLRARDLAADSAAAARAYAALLQARARIHRSVGDPLGEAHALLRAWRACGDATPPAIQKRVRRIIEHTCYRDGALAPIRENQLLARFAQSREAAAIRREFGRYPIADRVRLRYPRRDDDPERQGDLIILKRHVPETGEKGVILIAYTEAARRFCALFDVPAVLSRYMLVLEPCWWGFQDSTFLLFLGSDADVVVQATWKGDWHFIRGLGANLIPIRRGFYDWTDPDLFQPRPAGVEPTYDLVMVSAWSPLKRHEELFAALRRLRGRVDRPLRVALVGYPLGWTRHHIDRLARRYGLQDWCTIFDGIPHPEVARIVAASRAYILLSRREGGNRALYEAIFANVPVIVYRYHRGVNTEVIDERVGVLFEDGTLDAAILRVLYGPQTFEPRAWALERTGMRNSTRLLNELLRSIAVQRGSPWTADIAVKRNAPNLRYGRPEASNEFANEYEVLATFLAD